MKKIVQLTCTVIGLEFLEDGSIFSVKARRQERGSFVCKHRRTDDARTKVCILVYEIFTNSFFKSYTVIAMGRRALPKLSHCKLKPLQSDVTFWQ